MRKENILIRFLVFLEILYLYLISFIIESNNNFLAEISKADIYYNLLYIDLAGYPIFLTVNNTMSVYKTFLSKSILQKQKQKFSYKYVIKR